MLKNSVHPVDELQQVKNQADQYKTTTGNDINFNQYVSLLLSAATQYDAQFEPKKPPNTSQSDKHSVYAHDLGAEVSDDMSWYDIDSSVDTLQANLHGTSTEDPSIEVNATLQSSARLPFDKWKKLSSSDRKTWTMLSQSVKQLILGSTKPGTGTMTSPPIKRTVNLSFHLSKGSLVLLCKVALTSILGMISV